jgi:glycosyltransferase involved in cell wall biosynthesis
MKQPCEVLFIFSDVKSSPQLIAILEKFQKEKVAYNLILFGEGGSKLCTTLDSFKITYHLISISSKHRIPLVFLYVLKKTISFHPQAVYASGQFAAFVGMPAAFVARVQARVYTRHHSNFHQYYKMRLGLLADKITNIFATKVIAVSKIVNDILVSQERVPQSKVKIIYNGVAINEFQDASVDIDSSRGFLSNYADSIEIGVISRLTELKGVSYTAKAFVKFSREFPNAHLSIVGAKADSFDEVSRILSNVPSYRYHFVDFNDDIPSFLKSIDILVHVPIAIDIESFGLVYIEGLASGVPSVFTVSGILNEIPELYKYAQVVPYMDSEAIYLAMKRLVIDSCKSIHRCPTELLSEFRIEEMADSYFEVILP